jgi:16S rRNA (adenine1518-N6/adenine1519-N6)-dimethyltransferase
VERDSALHGHLAASLLPAAAARLHLLAGDAIEHPLAALPPSRAAAGFKIVANLPYAIATPWLDAVLSGALPDRMVLMLQQEAGRRYAADPGTKSFGAISIFLQAAFEVSRGHRVAAACFHPRPDVESLLLNFSRRAAPFVFPQTAKEIVRGCFRQRRKQIGALLRGQPAPEAAVWLEHLRAAGLSLKTRPEAIPVAQWIRLARGLSRA